LPSFVSSSRSVDSNSVAFNLCRNVDAFQNRLRNEEDFVDLNASGGSVP